MERLSIQQKFLFGIENIDWENWKCTYLRSEPKFDSCIMPSILGLHLQARAGGSQNNIYIFAVAYA